MAGPNDNDLDVTIRDGSRQIGSESLLELGNEPVPNEIFRDLLLQEWAATEQCPRPDIFVVNDKDNPGQANLRLGDVIIVDADEVTEQQRGHRYEHKDVEVPLYLNIQTVISRQRLYNLMAESRRIIYKWMMAARPFQQLYWDRFVDESEGKKNFWMGTCHIRATSAGVPVFTGVTTGMESPNVAPESANPKQTKETDE